MKFVIVIAACLWTMFLGACLIDTLPSPHDNPYQFPGEDKDIWIYPDAGTMKNK